MKFKNIFFITIILLAILSISAVSAADDIADDAGNDSTVDNVDDVPIVDSTDNSTLEDESNESSIVSSDLTKYYKNESQYHATFFDFNGTPIVNETVPVTINGKTYNRTTDQNGTITFNINLGPGNYTLNVTNPVTSEVASNLVTVLPTLKASDVVKYYKNGTQYYVNVVDGQGNPLSGANVRLNINGIFYNRTTDDKGSAKLSINLNSGKYRITAENVDNGEKTSNNITVLSTIESKDIKMYYKNGTKYSVSVVDGQGNPLSNASVKLNINGVYYNRNTDKNGTATLNINLAPGKYVITAENPVTGELASNTVEVLSTIVVKNSQSGGNISLEYKNGKYTVELHEKNGTLAANKTISFNINGVFYNRTSDDKGIASLSINLLPGNYIITGEFEGLKVSNTLKIRVTPSISVLNTTVKSGDYIKFRLTEKNTGNPITGQHYGIIGFNESYYGALPDSNGVCKIGVQLPADSYLFYFAMIDDGWYSSIMIGNTIKVIS